MDLNSLLEQLAFAASVEDYRAEAEVREQIKKLFEQARQKSDSERHIACRDCAIKDAALDELRDRRNWRYSEMWGAYVWNGAGKPYQIAARARFPELHQGGQ